MWVIALLFAFSACVFGPLLVGAAYEARVSGGSFWAIFGSMLSGLFRYVSRNIWSTLALLLIVCLFIAVLMLMGVVFRSQG